MCDTLCVIVCAQCLMSNASCHNFSQASKEMNVNHMNDILKGFQIEVLEEG